MFRVRLFLFCALTVSKQKTKEKKRQIWSQYKEFSNNISLISMFYGYLVSFDKSRLHRVRRFSSCHEPGTNKNSESPWGIESHGNPKSFLCSSLMTTEDVKHLSQLLYRAQNLPSLLFYLQTGYMFEDKFSLTILPIAWGQKTHHLVWTTAYCWRTNLCISKYSRY